MTLRNRLTRIAGRSGSRETLLFISPVVPALTGNGLAMRAAQSLLALATRYRVTLVVLPLYGSPSGREVPAQVQSACAASHIVRGGDASIPATDGFDVVHIFRLGMVPPAEPWSQRYAGKARLWLDLDDVESIVHRRVAALHRRLGQDREADAEDALARDAESREVAALMRFDRVFLASERDGERLPLHGAADIRHLPNVLPLPEPLPPPANGDSATLLFVGTLGYFPNVEGAVWFAREVLPLIRQRTRRSVQFDVVGTGWSPLIDELQRIPGVRVSGNVTEIRPWYERADAVVAPLRAGGGTRIKVIEAFGLGRPVIATPVGVEGIDARNGEHLLIADSADGFAEACALILDDTRLGLALTRRAHDLACERYVPAVLAEIVAGWT